MWPDRVSNPGPLTYESGALPTALRGPARANSVDTDEVAQFEPPLLDLCCLQIQLFSFVKKLPQTGYYSHLAWIYDVYKFNYFHF